MNERHYGILFATIGTLVMLGWLVMLGCAQSPPAPSAEVEALRSLVADFTADHIALEERVTELEARVAITEKYPYTLIRPAAETK